MTKSSNYGTLWLLFQKGTLLKHSLFCRLLLPTIFTFAASLPLAAQDNNIQWRQTYAHDDAKSMPSGFSLDVLGVAIGDTFEEAKAKLERISQEREGENKVEVVKSYFRIPTGNSSDAFLETSYPSMLKLSTFNETITLHVSAPSSGSEVYILDRLIRYYDKTKQAKISEVLSKIGEKYGFAPAVRDPQISLNNYRIQLDDLQPVAPPNPSDACGPSYLTSLIKTEQKVQNINRDGTCDVIIDINFNLGISENHAESIWFKIADLERVKAMASADYQFFSDYINELKSGGADAPKL